MYIRANQIRKHIQTLVVFY